MNSTILEASETDAPEPHWFARAAFPVISLASITVLGTLGFAVNRALYLLAVPLVLLTGHFMHGQLIGFHEASHGMLRKSRRLNEIDGIFIGVLSFMSFTLYRAAHQTHHMHLGTVRDEELWPFVLPEMPRWRRVLAAFLELFVGLAFTPYLFLRTFFRAGSPIRSKRVRRRVWAELALIAGFWIIFLSSIAVFDLWKYFLWMYLAPSIIAGNLQSWRKYIEHVGMTGSTIRGGTRSIVAEGPIGRLVSFTLLHEPYHGVHHQRAGLSHAELPFFAADLAPSEPDEFAPFPSYRHAFLHLIRELGDPRVGAQWRRANTAHK